MEEVPLAIENLGRVCHPCTVMQRAVLENPGLKDPKYFLNIQREYVAEIDRIKRLGE
jgi:hypothetical protein